MKYTEHNLSDSARTALHGHISVWTPRASEQSCKENIWIAHCTRSLLFLFCNFEKQTENVDKCRWYMGR